MPSTYLQESEYATFGLPSTLDASFVTRASALIDAHCHRAIAVTEYKQQLPMPSGRNQVLLTYTPIVSIVSADGRYGYPRRSESVEQVFPPAALYELSAVFGGPPDWEAIDVTQIVIDNYSNSGAIWVPAGIYMAQYTEIRVDYTAGYATIPDAVKMACAQIALGLQARQPGATSQRVGDVAVRYTDASLIDPTVRTLLAPYVAKSLR